MHRFAIIGAGAAGLAAVQQLRAVAGELPIEISVFERRASVVVYGTMSHNQGHAMYISPFQQSFAKSVTLLPARIRKRS